MEALQFGRATGMKTSAFGTCLIEESGRKQGRYRRTGELRQDLSHPSSTQPHTCPAQSHEGYWRRDRKGHRGMATLPTVRQLAPPVLPVGTPFRSRSCRMQQQFLRLDTGRQLYPAQPAAHGRGSPTGGKPGPDR